MNNDQTLEYAIVVTPKEIRKLGYDLGYGITKGFFSAMFLIHVGFGLAKGIKNHYEKKAAAAAKKETVEEPTDE